MRTRVRGFTLIQLVITLALVAILAAVAYPSYLSQVRKARRVDAREALVRVQSAQEDWRGTNTTYASSLAALSLSSTSQPYGSPPVSYYTLAVSGASATAYTATATATGTQASDTACATISVTVSAGQTTYSPSTCWGVP